MLRAHERQVDHLRAIGHVIADTQHAVSHPLFCKASLGFLSARCRYISKGIPAMSCLHYSLQCIAETMHVHPSSGLIRVF